MLEEWQTTAKTGKIRIRKHAKSSRFVTCALCWAVRPALFAGKLQDENVVAKDYDLVSSLLVMLYQEPCYGHLGQDEFHQTKPMILLKTPETTLLVARN